MPRFNFEEFYARGSDDPVAETDLRKIGDALQVNPAGPWICGGAVRRTILGAPLESDIDVFVSTEDQAAAVIAWCEIDGKKLGENDFCVTYSKTVADKSRLIQLIKPRFATPEAAIGSFDFTLCQTAYDGIDLIVGEYTLWDLGRMRIVPARITFGVASIRRLIKYTRQGFKVCSGGIANILEQIVSDPSIVNAQTKYLD